MRINTANLQSFHPNTYYNLGITQLFVAFLFLEKKACQSHVLLK